MSALSNQRLRIAVLIKQVPKLDELDLTAEGRLARQGLAAEINPYCRRAIAKGVELARFSGGRCTVFTLGPETAEWALREAIAWGADDGVLISDPAFAGSDTLATAKALHACLQREGPFDLVLTGLNSVDADTGQVGPQVAQLLGWPFLGGVRELAMETSPYRARLEHDDKAVTVEFELPCVLSTAERLCEPAKKPPEEAAAVPAQRIRRCRAEDLGPGPWGQAGSPTRVGEIRRQAPSSRQRLRFDGTDPEAVAAAVALLHQWGALAAAASEEVPTAAAAVDDRAGAMLCIGVVLEPGNQGFARELCGAARGLAAALPATVIALSPASLEPSLLGSWGVDEAIVLDGALLPEDSAAAVIAWAETVVPWAIIGPSTAWGRNVLARVAAATDSGLTGDAVDLELDAEKRLLAWKPAFCGQLRAAIHADSAIQMATVRPGVLPCPPLRPGCARINHLSVETHTGVTIVQSEILDSLEGLADYPILIGVGQGVAPEQYCLLDELKAVCDGELVATRKVTDKGWLPRARQIGLTGKAIAPRLYIAIGLSGRPYHAIGIRHSGWILAINRDPQALIFEEADIGLVGDWRRVVPLLIDCLRNTLSADPGDNFR